MSFWQAENHKSLVPLKYLCSINPEILPENTHPDFEMEYVDIGNVTFEYGVGERQSFHFSDAPSRARKIVRKGDTIVSTVRTYLKAIAYIDTDAKNWIVSTGFAVLRPYQGVYPRFLYRAIQANPFVEAVAAFSTGVSYPAINPTTLGRIEIPLPDYRNQKQIADFLDRETGRIDELILKKQQLCVLMREKIVAQTTMLVTRGLDSSAPMTETGFQWLPNAPAHWCIQRIASIYHESHELGEEGLPVLSVSINWGISDRQLEDEDRHRMVNHIEDKTKYKRVRPGDLVYNMMRAWQGAFGVTSIDGLVSPAYVVARPTETIYSPYFESLLRTPMCVEEFRRASKGIADFRQRLYWEHFRQVVVVLPPFEEQRAIVNKLSEETKKIEKPIETIIQSIECLQEFRSALITAAVTGQIDVTCWSKRGMTDQQLDTIESKTVVH